MSTGTLTRSDRARSDRARSAATSPVIDPRLQARRREVQRGRGRRRLRGLLVLAAVALAGAAVYGATRSPLLDVDHVRVNGVDGERAGAVHEAADVDRGAAMTGVDPDAVTRRVSELAWVDHVEVERNWPGTVAITVTERVAVAVDANGSAVDASGRSFGPTPELSLPVLEGTEVTVGADLPDELTPVLSVLSEVPDSLVDQIESAALVEGDVELTLVDGIEVRFGPDVRHRAKFTALAALLEQADRSTIDAIDLRVPTSPSLTRRVGTGA